MRPVWRKTLAGALVAAPLVAGGLYAYKKATAPLEREGGYAKVEWKKLQGLDYETGEASSAVARLDGQPVQVPGYVVPLEDNASGMSEFLLVPSPKACIHVPPPPPNQMILVRMTGGQPPRRSWGAVAIQGRLHVSSIDSNFGKVSYTMQADHAEPYRDRKG